MMDVNSNSMSINSLTNFEFRVQFDNQSNNNEGKSKLKHIDYVLVYSNTKQNQKQKENKNTYLYNLAINGLKLDFKKDQLYTYILVETPPEQLLEVAEKIKLKLPIEINNLHKENFFSKSFWHQFECFVPEEIKQDNKRKFFTASYESNQYEKFKDFFEKTKTDPLKVSLADSIEDKDRSMITYEILSRTTFAKRLDQPSIFRSEHDPEVGIDLLVANETFVAAYPIHEDYTTYENKMKTDRKLLKDYWANLSSAFIFQPLHIIRRYFGEKLSFYFAWLGFYTSWLVLPSIVGLLVFIYGCLTVYYDIPTNEICNKYGVGNTTMCRLCENNRNCKDWQLYDSCLYSRITYLVDNPATIFFSIFMAVWTVLFIEYWKREQSKLQFEWDTIDYQKKIETVRPEFELKVKEKRPNPVTLENEPFVSRFKIIRQYFFSAVVVLFMICLVLALVFGVIVYRVILMVILSNSDKTRRFSGTITSITAASINLIIIIVLSRFYAWLAVKLTNLEYHRTDSSYEDSLTIKMYLFQFVNFYASIFYIAFFKGRKLSKKASKKLEYEFQEECDQSGCLIELCIQLAIIMVGKQILNNIQEVLYPILQNYWSRGLVKKTSNKKTPLWTQDLKLLSWNSLTLFDEYLEMVIQFGFITLFVVAFPLGPLFAFLNNIIEIRIDAFKVLTQLRRPLAKRVQDIGIWLPILNIISKLGVITNGAIIAFTSEFIPRLVYKYAYGNGSLVGYVNHTLSVKISDDRDNPANTTSFCRYRDYRESVPPYDFTLIYYEVLAARLTFLVCFEHVVFFILTLMHCIPDVPKEIQNQIDRENLITQKAMWQTKSVNTNELEITKTTSQIFINTMNFSDNNIINSNEEEEKIDLESENLLT